MEGLRESFDALLLLMERADELAKLLRERAAEAALTGAREAVLKQAIAFGQSHHRATTTREVVFALMEEDPKRARRAVRLVRDLLDFAQAHVGGGIAVRRREMDLHALARQVVDELGQARTHVDMRMTGDAIGTWDPERLAQVMFNLLDNALTHGAQGGRVEIETRGEVRSVVISVHNEGTTFTVRLPRAAAHVQAEARPSG